jgi:hypothetical protein
LTGQGPVGDTTLLRGHFSGKITGQPAVPLEPLPRAGRSRPDTAFVNRLALAA